MTIHFPIEETDARGHKTTYTVNGDTSRNEEVTDRLGNRTAYEYDDSGRTTKVTSKKADGTELANVSYAYDTFDNMTEIVRGDGMKYALAYNEFHNLESIGIEGKSEALIKYAYKNGNGRLKQMTYANGHTMKAVYNSIGQMVGERWLDANGVETARYKYVYDGDGNIVRSIDISGKKEYNYEYEEGRIVRATESDITLNGEIVTSKVIVNTVKYYYDTEGKMTKKVITFSDNSTHTVHYENSDDNTVVKFDVPDTENANKKQTITSHSKTDSFGRKSFDELQIGRGFVSRQFSYMPGAITEAHKENRKIKSTATTQLVSQIALSDGRTISYKYDDEERIIEVTDSVDGTTEYTYDALGQLLTETVDGTVVNSMEYDNYGNITKKNGKVYTYGNSKWKDLLTSYNGQSITYDAQGNPTSYLGHTLTWEKGRQLKKFDNIEYTYNANGIRTSKKVNDVLHTYTLDGTKILRETWGSNTLIPLYDNEDGVCGILYNNVPYYFIKNLQGDVISIVDKDAQTVARYSYDAWGVPKVKLDSSDCQIATINPFRYRGYYYDEEIEIYYIEGRFYDRTIGRFICTDIAENIGATQNILEINLCSYCECDPINNLDLNGAISWKKILSVLNKVGGVAKKILEYLVDGAGWILGIKNSIRRKDISKIAKEAKRSPHRVRQCFEWLDKKVKHLKSKMGKILKALSYILFFSSIAVVLDDVKKFVNEVVTKLFNKIAEGLSALISWGLSKGIKFFSKFIPALGGVVGFLLGEVIGRALDILFEKSSTKIAIRYSNAIDVYNFSLGDYFITFFKCFT